MIYEVNVEWYVKRIERRLLVRWKVRYDGAVVALKK